MAYFLKAIEISKQEPRYATSSMLGFVVTVSRKMDDHFLLRTVDHL